MVTRRGCRLGANLEPEGLGLGRASRIAAAQARSQLSAFITLAWPEVDPDLDDVDVIAGRPDLHRRRFPRAAVVGEQERLDRHDGLVDPHGTSLLEVEAEADATVEIDGRVVVVLVDDVSLSAISP